MKITDYALDPSTFDTRKALEEWGTLLPEVFRVVMVTFFADMFLEDEAGAIHMIDTAGCCVKQVAKDRAELLDKLSDEERANRWLRRELVDALQKQEILLKPEYCYCWELPPRLGGDYDIDNVLVDDMYPYLSLLGQVAVQTKGMAPGAKVNFDFKTEG